MSNWLLQRTDCRCQVIAYPCGAVELVMGQVRHPVVGRLVQVPDVRPKRVVVARLGLLADLSEKKGNNFNKA